MSNVVREVDESLDLLKETKSNIRSAIEQKGVVVSDTDTFASYATKIEEISSTSINNQDKTVTENGQYTADEGYTGLGTVTVQVPQDGSTVEAIALGSAKTAVENDKVLLNPPTTFNGINNVVNGVYQSSKYHNLPDNYLCGGVFDNKIIMNFPLSADYGIGPVRFFEGIYKEDTITFTQKNSTTLGAVRLCPINLYNLGSRMSEGIYKLNADGSNSLVYNIGDIDSNFYEDTCFVSNGSKKIILVDNDYKLTEYSITDNTGRTPRFAFKENNEYFVIADRGESRFLYKVVKDSGCMFINNIEFFYTNIIQPLDEKGKFFLTMKNSSLTICYLNRDSAVWSFNNVASESIKISQGSLRNYIVIPITNDRDRADIFLMFRDGNLEHYIWDGESINKVTNILNISDLGEYIFPCDLMVDANHAVVIAVYATSAAKGSAMKTFVIGFDKIIDKQFSASLINTSDWGNKTLVGFVKSNKGLDMFGNTILEVSTTLDPNEEPWSDVGKLFGFNVSVEEGSL